jgi:hypothetical protein
MAEMVQIIFGHSVCQPYSFIGPLVPVDSADSCPTPQNQLDSLRIQILMRS